MRGEAATDPYKDDRWVQRDEGSMSARTISDAASLRVLVLVARKANALAGPPAPRLVLTDHGLHRAVRTQ